jgi:GxxExxY protein
VFRHANEEARNCGWTKINSDKGHLNELSRLIIGRAFQVQNTLGVGFLEKDYENALAYEISQAGLGVQQQYAVEVRYNHVMVGVYAADMLVDSAILVELKAVKALDAIHVAQCINYLKATGLPLCLLLNFGHPRLEIRRLVNGT